MLDLFTATRMLVDYLWEIKVLSALHLALFVGAWFLAVMSGRRAHWKKSTEDALLIAFAGILTLSYLRSQDEETTIIFAKMISFMFAFWMGRLMYIKPESMQLTKILSIVGLICIGIAAAMGIGYQTWGGADTLSAGYYFKTDLALSAALALSIILVYSESKCLKACMLVIAGWIVFKANARIFIPVFLLLPLVHEFYLKKARKKGALLRAVVVAGLASVATIVFFSVLPTIVTGGYLGFDLSEGFSDANTQGRSVIWAGALEAWHGSNTIFQIFGASLDADKRYIAYQTGLYAEQYSAHNSFLYLLIATGVIGSLVYGLTVLLVAKKAMKGIRSDQDNQIEQLFTLLLLIYMFCGLTTDAVIRPQIMMPFWMFAGVVVRRAQLRRSAAKRARLMYPHAAGLRTRL